MTGTLLTSLIAFPALAALLVPGQATAMLYRIRQGTVAIWIVCGAGWLVAAGTGLVPARMSLEIVDLLEFHSTGASIAIAADLSPVTVGLLLSGLLLAVPCVLTSDVDCEPPGSAAVTRSDCDEPIRMSLGVFLAGTVALLTSDLVVLAAVWLILDTLCVRFIGASSSAFSPVVDRDRRPSDFLTVLRLSSIALLAAVLLVVTRYGTTSVSEFVSAALNDERVDARVVRGGIVVWFALAVIGRAAMFPATVWLRSLTDARSRDVLPVVVWATVLPAVGLWLALSPLLVAAPENALLITALGTLSGVMVGMMALASFSEARSSAFLFLAVILGVVSLVSVSVPTIVGVPGSSESLTVATMSLVIGLAAIGVLADMPRHRTASIAAALILIGGVGGTAYILDELTALRLLMPGATESDLTTVAAGSPASIGVVTGLWWAVCVLQFLIGTVVARVLFDDDDSPEREAISNARDEPGWFHRHVAPVTIGLGLAVWLGLGVIAANHNGTESMERSVWSSVLSFNAATPAGLLGCLSIWMFQNASEAARDRVRRGLATFERLARNWFYIDVIARQIAMPLQWLAALIEFLDRRVIGSRREDAWRQGASRIGNAIEDVDEHGAAYPGLAAVLALAGLLLALAGLGG